MIASVVATLKDDADRSQTTLADIAARPQIEIGEFTETDRRIPLTIDSADRSDVESATTWLQQHSGIVFVDIVFVHFEDTDSTTGSETFARRRHQEPQPGQR